MILTKHELKQGFKAWLIWTLAIGGLMVICVAIFPEMKDEMNDANSIFSSMGTFSKAFGLDVLNFGTLKGYYAVNCGSILGIGCALFSALIGISMLTKEEETHTSEFLFAHPLSRTYAVFEKALAVFLQLLLMSVTIFFLCAASILLIGETVFWKELTLLHFAFFLVQIEISSFCFFFSSILRSSGAGVGLGFALVLYFLNLIANISESTNFLKYATPFSYAEPADILQSGKIEMRYLLPGICLAVLVHFATYYIYHKKDLR